MNTFRKYPHEDYKGRRINKLFVLGFAGYLEDSKKRRHTYWRCKCECGNETVIRTSQLKNGQLSCGCELENFRKNILPGITSKRNAKPAGVAAFNNLLINYKSRAKKKNIDFLLTNDEFRFFTKQKCFYCGREPYHKVKGGRKRTMIGDYIYNGIDRIDSRKGYIKENCLTCCGICNKAKRDIGFNIFIEWIRDLTNYASSINFNYERK